MTDTDTAPQRPAPDGLLADYMSEEQCADELGVCRRTVQRWRRLRRGPPPTIVAQRIMFRRGAVAKWLLAREGAARGE